MNKRGFIKTLEAVLAVIIVFIFIFSLSKNINQEDNEIKIMRGLQEGVLKGISENDDFRECIVSTNDNELNKIGIGGTNDPCSTETLGVEGIRSYISKTLPGRFVEVNKERYKIGVCAIGSCNLTPNVNIERLYTSAVVISSDLEQYNPRIVRIWMW